MVWTDIFPVFMAIALVMNSRNGAGELSCGFPARVLELEFVPRLGCHFVMEAGKIPRTAKVTFGLFEFDVVARQLRKQGRELKLQDLPSTAFDVR